MYVLGSIISTEVLMGRPSYLKKNLIEIAIMSLIEIKDNPIGIAQVGHNI